MGSDSIFRILSATKAIHAHDNSLGVACEAGMFQVQRVTYNAKGKSTVIAVSGWLCASDLVSFSRDIKDLFHLDK